MSSVQTVAGTATKEAKQVSFRDVFWTGCSLLVAIGLSLVGAGYVVTFIQKNGIDNSTDSEDELITIHNQVEEYRTGLLISVALLWLSIPFFFTHIYCFKLLCESLFASLVSTDKPNSVVHYLKWMYILNFLMVLFMICLIGIFTFLASYYHWSFVDTSNDTSYIGYYIQFMLLAGVVAINECGTFFLGIVSLIPWVLLLLSDSGAVARNDFCCFTWCCSNVMSRTFIQIIMLLFIFAVVVATGISTFDWASNGFFDPDNGALDLDYIVVLSIILEGLWFIYLSFKIKSIGELINAENNKQNYSVIRGGDVL